MNLVSVKSLYKKYKSKAVLEDISFEIEEGTITYFIGENGVGKTTLLRILAGLLCFDAGTIKIANTDITKKNKIKGLIGYVQQSKSLPPSLTVKEYLKYQTKIRNGNIEYANELLSEADLDKHGNDLISQISEGSQRKLHIITSLIHKPSLLILDEPTIGLDPIVKKRINEYVMKLKKSGISAIITTHNLEEAIEFRDKIILISNNRIKVLTEAEISKIKSNELFLEEMYGN